ncbi:MAG: hypothetical protein LH477_06920 [Nocardioides sp.]|nr:hypothetical protein [Nocardioides sp.]
MTETSGLPLWSDYTRFVRRHRGLVGALIAVGLLGGWAWSMLLQPVTFSATASVALTSVPVYVAFSSSDLVPPEVSIDTDAQLLYSPRVQGAVATALGEDVERVGEHLSVTASPNSHVLHVSVTAASARRAAEAADAAVTAFVDVRREALGALTLDQQAQLRLRLSDQERLLAGTQARRLVIPASDDLFAQVLELRTSLNELEDARSTPGDVLGAAVVPDAADRANTEVPLVSGAMLGLLGGCLLGAARDRTGRHSEHPHRRTVPLASGDLPDVTIRHEDHDHAV